MSPRASDDPGAFGRLSGPQVPDLESTSYQLDSRLVRAVRPAEEWSVSFLLSVHRELFAPIFSDRAGALRVVEVTLRALPVARPGQILHRLADLVAMAQETIERVSSIEDTEQKMLDTMRSAARFHAACVVAQPFIDGNKRWARLVLNALLVDCDFRPGTTIDDAQQHEYMRAIDDAVAGEPDPLAELILQGWIAQRALYRSQIDSDA